MTPPPRHMPDEDHIRYMLDGSDRGLIHALTENAHGWTFGGGLWLARTKPMVAFESIGPSTPDPIPMNPWCRFEATPFHLADTGARGFALWFQSAPRDEHSSSLDNRFLCGWIPVEREHEATEWLRILNEQIRVHLLNMIAEWEALTDEQRHEAIANERYASNRRRFERMGIPMPRDLAEFKRLATGDEPIAGRDHAKPPR